MQYLSTISFDTYLIILYEKFIKKIKFLKLKNIPFFFVNGLLLMDYY